MAALITAHLALPTLASAQTVTVTAEWDPNTDAVTAGYLLQYGTAPGNYQWTVDAGNQVSTPVTLQSGSVYYFVVSAYDAAAVQGPPSTEAAIDLRAPSASITAALQSTGTALVTWQTANATSATINGNAVALTGSTTVTVTATTTFTLVATGVAGLTATSSATVTVPTSGLPGPPSQMTSQVSGGTVTLAWKAPTVGGAPQTYLLDVGTTIGGTNVANAIPVGNVLTVSGSLPKGRYYARVRAANASGVSSYSNTASFRIGKSLPTPTGFTVQWSDSTATLSWTASDVAADGAQPTSYVLEAGTAPGLSDVGSLAVGNVTRFTATVPSGTYYVRVRATSVDGDSDPTPDLMLVPPGAPGAPKNLLATAAGPVFLRWTAPSGAAVTNYVIEAGSAPGLADLASVSVGAVQQFSAVAPPGTYYIRVRAQNARGLGPPSNEVVVRR